MFPVWFFIILILIICYLLILTRPSEDSLLTVGRNNMKKVQKFWFRNQNR